MSAVDEDDGSLFFRDLKHLYKIMDNHTLVALNCLLIEASTAQRCKEFYGYLYRWTHGYNNKAVPGRCNNADRPGTALMVLYQLNRESISSSFTWKVMLCGPTGSV